jgi:surfeit locus 1 family protein
MLRRVPVLATLVVLAAVAVMVALGFWQLDRLKQKEALLARYAQSASMSSEVRFEPDSQEFESSLYRRSRIDCVVVKGMAARAGHDAKGRTGWAHVARCQRAGGGEIDVALGWSESSVSPSWQGGLVRGTIAPGPRLVADPPLAGLQANARPDPNTIPNNHLAYAVQWFLFALTALVIYAIALRKRIRGS